MLRRFFSALCGPRRRESVDEEYRLVAVPDDEAGAELFDPAEPNVVYVRFTPGAAQAAGEPQEAPSPAPARGVGVEAHQSQLYKVETAAAGYGPRQTRRCHRCWALRRGQELTVARHTRRGYRLAPR